MIRIGSRLDPQNKHCIMNAVNNACAVKYPPDSADMKYDKLSNVTGQKDAKDYSNRSGSEHYSP